MSDGAGKETALEARGGDSARMTSPSAARNRDPILETYRRHMPHRGAILEVGSGTGEHAIHIAGAFPHLHWAPGDPDPSSRQSIEAWRKYSGLQNIDEAHDLDVTAPGWAESVSRPITGVVSINMIHIAPFEAAEGLFAGAGDLLPAGGRLLLYGPFSRNGAHTAPSNAEFDARLMARDRRWGVRDLDNDIYPLARASGLTPLADIAMPANNLSVIFEKRVT